MSPFTKTLFGKSPYVLSELYGGEWDDGLNYSELIQKLILKTLTATVKVSQINASILE